MKNQKTFYTLSFIFISILFGLFLSKFNDSVQAAKNIESFKKIKSDLVTFKTDTSNHYKIYHKEKINYYHNNYVARFDVKNINYRMCLKYGLKFSNSDFDYLFINNNLIKKNDFTFRDTILNYCNDDNNNLIFIGLINQ